MRFFMSSNEVEIPDDQPYKDLHSAREDVRIFARPKTTPAMIKHVCSRLMHSDPDYIQPILRNVLDNFDNLITESIEPVFEIIEHVLKNSSDISKIIPPLSILAGNRSIDVRERATGYLCSVGPLAKPAEDMAMGCLRNNDPNMRLCGAKILYSIGAACSRSITRQLRSAAQRYKDEREFCALLVGTVKRINSVDTPLPARQPSSSSLRLRKVFSAFKGKKLLLVEDNSVLRETIEDMLKTKLEVNVLTAGDGRQALNTISALESANELPDYIILDLKIPEVNGVHVLNSIKSKAETRNIPVIVITAVADERILNTIELMGIVAYLKKPFRLNDLIRAMVSNLNGQTAAINS